MLCSRGDDVKGLLVLGGGSTRGLVPARAGSYSLAKSARATYAAATTPAATASGGNDLAAGAGGERSALGGVAQRFAGLFASSFFASLTASSTRCRWSRTLSTRSARDDAWTARRLLLARRQDVLAVRRRQVLARLQGRGDFVRRRGRNILLAGREPGADVLARAGRGGREEGRALHRFKGLPIDRPDFAAQVCEAARSRSEPSKRYPAEFLVKRGAVCRSF